METKGGHDIHTLLVEQGKHVKEHLDAHPVLPFLEGVQHIDESADKK